MHPFFRKKSISHIIKSAEAHTESGMKRKLGVRDLTFMGIAAIIGAGIFSTIGNAASSGGPAVSLLFVFTAIACGFSAMCYAEFASTIPISGSAYTYAYASFGELLAWIIGWDLIMEYAIGNIAVAISWSEYFVNFMKGLHIHIPEFLTIDYMSAAKGFSQAVVQLASGISVDSLDSNIKEAYLAWTNAPTIGSLRLIADVPAFAIVGLITWLVYKGIQETKTANNIMVFIKLAILFAVIAIGGYYVDTENWSPFAPNGLGGVLKGVSSVFFAYIGFDAVSTTAEECKNPRRDLPLSMMLSLIISTVLYVAISLVLTGMIPYNQLGVADPLAYAFEKLHLTKLSGIIAVSAVIAMASVLLVFQVGQPRIWMSMSRDGLLPPRFSMLHPKFKTPTFATLVAGVLVAIPALFMNLVSVTDLTSIGTLFAFVLVSGGILVLYPHGNKEAKGFRVPYINSRFILPLIWVIVLVVYFVKFHHESKGSVFFTYHNIPLMLFFIVASITTVMAVIKKWTLIPVLGLITNLYLMSQVGITNWIGFSIWLLIGLAIYLLYGIKHSKLRKEIQ